ncbi:acid phosphatase [Amycolatopsis sp. RM579]|uniref:Acid phosphatase n=1 Tax=Amycolatopsis pithecellobii TaxID=664692 RepID=A0A6N7Z2W7_9PSEU|nr:acid phosphatase [Amycolatopsis pithecellobii]
MVVLENHNADAIIGAPDAPYLTSLADQGAVFTNAHAITHPSQPNYLALFSGDTQGITDDSCPHSSAAANLGSELTAAQLSFAGYSEDLPGTGYTGCFPGQYDRNHAPWVDFTNLPGSVNLPYTQFPPDPERLPTLSFVIPNLCHDMHNCDVATGDSWLHTNIAGYLAWARAHNSMLVITFDESDDSPSNRIATMVLGPMVVAGQYGEYVDHYRMLRTLEQMYRLPALGHSAQTAPVTDVWTH